MAKGEVKRVRQHVGAAGELRIGADLLLRGYEVYRNVSSAGADLIAYKNGRYLRVEVRSTQLPRNSKPCDVRAAANDRKGNIVYEFEGRTIKMESLMCSGIQREGHPDLGSW